MVKRYISNLLSLHSSIKVFIIILIACIWRLILFDSDFGEMRARYDPYVSPIIFYVFFSILLGEATRRFIGVFKQDKIDQKRMRDGIIEEKLSEEELDQKTSDLSLIWAIIFIVWTIIKKIISFV